MAHVELGRYKRVVQYFWDPEPVNDMATPMPIWCLGKEYTQGLMYGKSLKGKTDYLKDDGKESPETAQLPTLHSQPNPREPESVDAGEGAPMPINFLSEKSGWPHAFLDDFESKFWFTYRSHFPPIKRSTDPGASSSMSLSVRLRSQLVEHAGFTSDTGWGCMIRSGQCLLANALAILRFGRGWRHGFQFEEEQKLLALFADDLRAPFSLHNFVEHGASACGKYPGEWFGPSATARCIQALSEKYTLSGLRVYVTGDGSEIYEDVLLKLARSDRGLFFPVLILVGIRLGIDRVNPVYRESLKATLQMPQSIGIAGGRPSSSHYFVGVQGNDVFYLDPHQTQPALPWHENSAEYSIKDLKSCHTRRLRRLSIVDMDPSMLIAFLIRDAADWVTWRESMVQSNEKSVVRFADSKISPYDHGAEREGAVDEVETFDDDEDGLTKDEEGDGELINPPTRS